MSAFDFLNTKYFIDKIAKDKRKKGANTLYSRFRTIARGNNAPIEDYEMQAFYNEYANNDKLFRDYIKTNFPNVSLTKSKS